MIPDSRPRTQYQFPISHNSVSRAVSAHRQPTRPSSCAENFLGRKSYQCSGIGPFQLVATKQRARILLTRFDNRSSTSVQHTGQIMWYNRGAENRERVFSDAEMPGRSTQPTSAGSKPKGVPNVSCAAHRPGVVPRRFGHMTLRGRVESSCAAGARPGATNPPFGVTARNARYRSCVTRTHTHTAHPRLPRFGRGEAGEEGTGDRLRGRYAQRGV